jgi:alpha-galactosidase
LYFYLPFEYLLISKNFNCFQIILLKAITPPMGWRSWNLYGANVNQKLIEGIIDGMVARKRMVDGRLVSLCDLGYCDVGLDDNWQACGSGAGTNFHDANGYPIVNLDRFPDMLAMTTYAHKHGLTAGWYGNNCICSEQNTADRKYYEGDVNALIAFGYDAVKLDGCGAQTDLQLYYELFNATGKAITIENCHWGSQYPFEPNSTWCPWNFYRTSGDVRAEYSSIISNLQTTIKYALSGLSGPGCWAYPDMLEVGCANGPGGPSDPGLTPQETRSHFGAWSIVSSPLTLSHDVNNDTIMDAIWPVIANPEVINVNQAWYGHSGSPFYNGTSSQYFYKPIGRNQVAVLLMNQVALTNSC